MVGAGLRRIFEKKRAEEPPQVPWLRVGVYESARLCMRLEGPSGELTRCSGNWVPSGIAEVAMRPCPMYVAAVEAESAAALELAEVCEPYCHDLGPIHVWVGDDECVLERFRPQMLSALAGPLSAYESAYRTALPLVQSEPRPTAAHERYGRVGVAPAALLMGPVEGGAGV